MSKLNIGKVRAFFQEFPFLSAFVDEKSIQEVHVFRVFEQLLGLLPNQYDPFYGTHIIHRDIFICDKFGHVITKVKSRSPSFLTRYFPNLALRDQETLGQAIERMGEEARKIAYVVSLKQSSKLTVYKMPREWGFSELTAHCIAQANKNHAGKKAA